MNNIINLPITLNLKKDDIKTVMEIRFNDEHFKLLNPEQIINNSDIKLNLEIQNE